MAPQPPRCRIHRQFGYRLANDVPQLDGPRIKHYSLSLDTADDREIVNFVCDRRQRSAVLGLWLDAARGSVAEDVLRADVVGDFLQEGLHCIDGRRGFENVSDAGLLGIAKPKFLVVLRQAGDEGIDAAGRREAARCRLLV